MGRLDGAVAVVTGAARGQGRAHAIRLAQEGADVIAIDLGDDVGTVDYAMSTPADLLETAALVEAAGRRCVAGVADIRDRDTLASVVDAGVEALGRLDIVVANAGVAGFAPDGTCGLPLQAWQDMIDINLTGTWNTAAVCVPHLRRAGWGSIVAISSISGLKGADGLGHYVAAKHGVVGLVKSLAIELGPFSIRVNAVLPTEVRTPMLVNPRSMRLYLPDEEQPTIEQLAQVTANLHVLPVPWVEPEDVSNAVVFLSSPEARYITGVCLPVDAGALLK